MIPAISGAIGPLGSSEWSVGGVGGLGGAGSATTAAGVGAVPPAGSSGSFGAMLSKAVDSVQQTQATADASAQGLATGTLSDPTQAITAVENASLQMDFASQIVSKLTTDVNTVFQTQM